MDFRYGYILITFMDMAESGCHSTGAPPAM
jgi:hypothetical protein